MRRTLTHLALAAGLALSVPAARAAECSASTPYPAADWPQATQETAARKAAEIKALEDFTFTLTGADGERKGTRTDGVVILRGGSIVYERYARGWDAQKRHLAWSVSKTFTNALVGRAVQEGKLQLSDSLCKWLPATRQDNCGITVQHLLEMASGLDWHEVYENQSNQASSVLAMLYGEGHEDMAAFVADHAPRDPPGQSWEYSTGDATLLAAVAGKALRPAFGDDYAWKLLFTPIGAPRIAWERDKAGTHVGGSYVYATARDMARLGYLFLHDGCWAGQRLLPEGWVHDSVQVNEPFKKKRVDRDPGDVYGRQIWLNQKVPGIQDELPWKGVPEDAYAALGHWGQSVTVIPSLDLVIVRVADDRDGTFDRPAFLERAIAVGTP